MKKYDLLSNIKYVMRSSRQVDRNIFYRNIASVPINYLSMGLDLIIPSICLFLFQDNRFGFDNIIIAITFMAGLRICFQIAINVIVSTQYIAEHKMLIYFTEKLNKKLMNIEYSKLEDPSFKVKCGKAETCVENNHTEFIHLADNSLKALGSIFKFILFCFILTKLAWWIIILLLITAGLQLLTIVYVDNYEHKTKNERIKVLRKIFYISRLSNDYKSGKDIRIFGMRRWLKSYFSELLNEHSKLYEKLTSRRIIFAFFNLLVIVLRDGGAYFYLGYLAIAGRISPALFVLYFGVISEFVDVLGEIVDSFEQVSRGNYQAKDYRDFIDEGEGLPGKTMAESDSPKAIELRNVSFTFPGSDKQILKDINLKIEKGEKIALVGLNGTGKTTLIKIICGMYRPTSGHVLIDGIDVEQYDKKEYYKCFSTVFQNISVFPYSIKENIVYGREDERKLKSCCKIADLDRKINTLKTGYNTRLIRNVFEDAIDLSGGEMQKMALARALYKSAGVLILDEPTAALDPLAEERMYKRYNELTKNMTSIFISHRLASTRFCDRIILLENGMIKEQGSHDTLLKKNGKYAMLFNIQSQYYN